MEGTIQKVENKIDLNPKPVGRIDDKKRKERKGHQKGTGTTGDVIRKRHREGNTGGKEKRKRVIVSGSRRDPELGEDSVGTNILDGRRHGTRERASERGK